jgi:hypothetical protein
MADRVAESFMVSVSLDEEGIGSVNGREREAAVLLDVYCLEEVLDLKRAARYHPFRAHS